MNPPSAVLGGVHGKVCWLIAYYFLHVKRHDYGYKIDMLTYATNKDTLECLSMKLIDMMM